ncbi:MAG: hypothetical protein ACR2LM_05440 [Pyrinomonadaceae bacterium]
MTGVKNKFRFTFCCCLFLGIANIATAKSWRGIIPLHSTRSEVRKLLGKPIIGGEGAIDLYEINEGRVRVMYARRPCEEGLPADWGNWRIPHDTVVNISIQLHKEFPLRNLRIRNIERFKWYTGASGATYYRDRARGLEFQVQEGMVTAITYGPMIRDRALQCKKNVPLLRY